MKYTKIVAAVLVVMIVIGMLPAQAIGEAFTEHTLKTVAADLNASGESLNVSSLPGSSSTAVMEKSYEELLAEYSPYSNILEELPETRENNIFRENEYFSELSTEEAIYLIAETGFSRETFESLEEAGYTLEDSAIYGRMQRDYDLNLEKMIDDFSEKGEAINLSIDADMLNAEISENFSAEVGNQMMECLLSDNSVDDIINAGDIAEVLGIEVLSLLAAEGSYETPVDDTQTDSSTDNQADGSTDNQVDNSTGSQADGSIDNQVDDSTGSQADGSLRNPIKRPPENTIGSVVEKSTEEINGFREKCEELGVNPDPIIAHATANSLSLDDFIRELEARRGNRERRKRDRAAGNLNTNVSSDGRLRAAAPNIDQHSDRLNPFITPTYTYDISANDQYNVPTGSFTHKEIDVVLPGRNGLDLVIGRVYNSFDDLNYITADRLIENSQKQWHHGLGSGWQFMFSFVEIHFGTYLHTSDGATYAYDSSSASGLKDYTLKDLKFTRNSNGTFTLYHKDGKEEHFDTQGKLVSIKDKYNNTIRFSQTYSSSEYANRAYTTVITDSLGNQTTIRKDSSGVITITLPDQSTLEYTTFAPATPSGNNLTAHYYTLKSFTDQMQNTTNYDYLVHYDAYSFVSNSFSAAAYTQAYALREIKYPTTYSDPKVPGDTSESILFWSESKPVRVRKSVSVGFREKFFLTSKTARVQNVNLSSSNLQVFSIPDYTGYNYIFNLGNPARYGTFDPNKPPAGYTFSNRVRTSVASSTTGGSDTYNYTYSEMNNLSLVTSETTRNGMASGDPERGSQPIGVLLSSVSRTYNSNKLPEAVFYKSYSPNGSNAFDQSELYRYDDYGNVTEHRSVLGDGSSWDPEYTTTYSYGYSKTNYCYLERVQYKQDANTTIRQQYTYSSDKNSIQLAEVYVENVLKEKTGYNYDSYGNITAEMRYTGSPWTSYNTTSYSYDRGAFLQRTTNSDVRTTDGGYATGTPGYPAGTICTSSTYDTIGRLRSTTDGNGNTTQYEYNARGDITRLTNPGNSYIQFNRDYRNGTLDVIDERGYTTRHYFNIYGDEYKTTAVSGGSETILAERRYSVRNDLLEEKNAYSNITYTYDNKGRITSKHTTNSSSAAALTSETETYEYNDAYTTSYQEVIKTVKNTSGVSNIYAYLYTDKAGNVISTGKRNNSMIVYDNHTYDYLGNKTRTTTAGGVKTAYTYDYAGRVTSIKKVDYDNDPNTIDPVSTNTYNALGNLINTTDFEGNRVTYDYDALGRNIKTYSLVNKNDTSTYGGKKYYYRAGGELSSESVKNSQKGVADTWRSTSYGYDNRNRLTSASSGNVTSSYTYDAVGNMRTLTVGSSTTTYTYDRFNNVEMIRDALNQTERFTYNSIGQPSTYTDRNGNRTVYTLDALGREYTATTTARDGKTIIQDSRYAPNGELASKTDSGTGSGGTKTLAYTYDFQGRLTSANYNNSAQVSEYTYHADGQRSGYTLKRNNTQVLNETYRYNNQGLLETVTEGGVERARYTYNTNGLLLTETLASGNVTTYSNYNVYGQPEGEAHSRSGSSTINFTYAYYGDGNTYTKTGDNKTVAYSYDNAGRLRSEMEVSGGSATYRANYLYDNRGNREQMTVSGSETYSIGYSYDSNNRLMNETKSQGTRTDKTTYYYDPNGNQITRLTTTTSSGSGNASLTLVSGVPDDGISTYDGLNRLVGIVGKNGNITYSYRPDGMRAGKTVGSTTTTHFWDLTDIVAETVGSTTTTYLRGVGLIASKSGSTYTYYDKNSHGDTYRLLNSSGTATKTYVYDAFGTQRSPSLTTVDANPFRYCGEYFDNETGSIYLRARYYAPGVGRFTQADTHWNPGNMIYGDNPHKWNEHQAGLNNSLRSNAHIYKPDSLAIMQSGNLYIYCMSNPLGFVDPTGELAYPGQIHNLVVNDVAKRYGYNKEQTIDYKDSVFWGRADLISASGEVWDVKRDKPRQIASGVNQVFKYTQNTWKKNPDINLSVGGYIKSGSFEVKINVDTYYVSYRYAERGVIAYDYNKVTDWQKVTTVATGAAMVVGAAFLIYATGGAAAPVFATLLK